MSGKKRDEEDASLEDSDEDENDQRERPKKRKKIDRSFIDDAAEESGDEEGDDEEEDDDDDENNDYIKDGFVVDEEEVEKKQKDDLEDSDDDDDGDDDGEGSDDENDQKASTRKRLKKLRAHDVDRLDEEDLALIQESKQEDEQDIGPPPEVERARVVPVARSEAELRRGLFDQQDDEEEDAPQARKKEKVRVERYDEDGMDDFIDDDIGDQGEIMRSDRRGLFDEETREVSEAQLNEASEIFGTDYLEFMGEDQPDQDEEELMGTYRERGVGVDYGVDSSDEEALSDDEDDLFEDDEEDEAMDGTTAQQKKEALRLKREKRKLAKAERRRQAIERKAQRRKAQLRKAFEPVQLVENFCTDRDDDIRQSDVPERMYDWKTPFHGSEEKGLNAIEREQAQWIAEKIPAISAELAADESERERVLESIANALRFMHCDNLEPAFIKRYRQDYVVSPSVLDNLGSIMDQDTEYDRLIGAKQKVEALLSDITVAADSLESQGADVQKLTVLQEQLDQAQKALDETATKETQIKHELEALGAAEDDDDELFGDDDGDEEEKKKERDRLASHLSDLQMLLEAKAEKVSQLQSQVRVVEAQNRSLNDPGPVERITMKMCRNALWNVGDYTEFLTTLSDPHHVIDANRYLNLIKEGNEAIRKKELPALVIKDDPSEVRRRSRRFDHDFYRTCVSEGLRTVGYKFLLSPVRAGIKLEDSVTKGRFDFSRAMPGEDGDVDPLGWVAPAVPSMTPSEFASDLIGSGELVLLSSTAGGEADAAEADDPLRGCRYVAAIELAHEPRVRRVLRDIYRKRVLISTRPSKKGTDTIDAFHDYYGLHLIRGKPASSHFPMTPLERESRTSGLGFPERKELDKEMGERERQSCLQYLHMLKAEQSGDIEIIIHLPFIELRDDWYKLDMEQLTNHNNHDLNLLTNELEKVYLPLDVDVDQFNDERRKVIQQALTVFLLPQFEAELRRELKDAAVRAGIIDAAKNLREMAMVGPYRPAAIAHTENRFVHPTEDLPFVGICCSSDVRDATYLAAVTEHGQSGDFLAVPMGVRVDTGKMREKVIMFLVQARAAAVIIGTSGGFESRMVQRKMVDLVKEAVERWNKRDIQGADEDDEAFEARQAAFRQLQPPGQYDDEEDDEWTCNVELIDDSVSQLFGRSVRSKKEFPDYSVNLRCAISIARYAKDPLSELAYAWGVASDAGVFGTEMLFLNIHPLQQLLPKTPLLRHYERVLCDVVADVGVDLNASCAHDHLRGLLTFVAGLGPRKAAFLKQTVTQMGGSIGRRNDLLLKRFLGPKVYNNAVAFLRVRETDQVADHYVHPLDDTRLHPDVYLRNNWAIKIAFDALEREDPKGKEAAAIKAVRDVMEDSHNEVERLLKATKQEWERNYGHAFNVKEWNPRVNVPPDMWRDKVEDLDLEAFASKLDEYGSGRWHSHLNMIKWEFRLPFADPRNPLESLSAEKLFHLITGETDQSLRPGKEITGKIVMNGDFGSRVKLEGDIPAFIPLRNISDEHVEAAEDYLSVGQVITALVTEVKKDHMTVDLSLRKEDFQKPPSSWERPLSLPRIDDSFDLSAAAKTEDESNKKREARVGALLQSLGRGGDDRGGKRGRVVRRACTHPAFRNARHSEVDRELKEAGAAMVGEALIRPSSKSSDSLAIHWVVREGSIKVIEVTEEDKETDASIGNVLKIKGESYGSIDELLGRYIAPMNDYVEELANHRKFMDLPEDDVDQKLKAQKKANPAMIPYAVCWLETHPGYGSIRFVAQETPRGHTIGITPRGFSWGSHTFSSLDELLNVFKRNPQGPRDEKKQQKPAPSKPLPPKPSRWTQKPPVPLPTAVAGWDRPPPPPIPPAAPSLPATGGWGTPSSIPVPANVGWSQHAPPPPPRPPPQSLPPPPTYGGPPPTLPLPPPPPGGPPAGFGRPPPPPPQGAFDFPPPDGGQGRGRGRGRTLPAWMSKG